MRPKVINTWTGTEGAVSYIDKIDIYTITFPKTIEIPLGFKGIRSYVEFKKQIISKTGKYKNASYKKLDQSLLNIQDIFNQDPIEFLYFLYYELELSAIEIYNQLHKLFGYNNKKRDSFVKLFGNTFGWELRDNYYITEKGKTRIRESNIDKRQSEKEVRKNTAIKLYNVLERVSKYKTKDYLEKLEGKNKMEKLKQFLEFYGYKPKYMTLKDFFTTLNKKYSFKHMEIAINKLLLEKGFNLKINKGRISEVLKGKYNL